jgi:hypothetical protein
VVGTETVIGVSFFGVSGLVAPGGVPVGVVGLGIFRSRWITRCFMRSSNRCSPAPFAKRESKFVFVDLAATTPEEGGGNPVDEAAECDDRQKAEEPDVDLGSSGALIHGEPPRYLSEIS